MVLNPVKSRRWAKLVSILVGVSSALLVMLAGVARAAATTGFPTAGDERGTELPPGFEVFTSADEIPDMELARTRGRFARGRRLQFFGVEMLTQWQTAAGQVYVAGLNMDMDWDAVRFRPTISIVRSVRNGRLGSARTADTSPIGDPKELTSTPNGTGRDRSSIGVGDSSADVVTDRISGGGIKNIAGVGQIIQVTGDGNRIQNDLILDITTRALTDSAAQDVAGNVSQVEPVTAGTEITVIKRNDTSVDSVDAPNVPGGTSHTVGSDTEVIVTTAVNRNGLGVSIDVPGEGLAEQTINSLIGARQNIHLTGDMNRVLNTLILHARFRETRGVTRTNLRPALRSLLGLQQQGMY